MGNREINEEQDVLDLQDLLVDESNDILSEYLSISIENLSGGAKVSVCTVEDQPAMYSSILVGVTVTDLHCLVDVPTET